MAASPSDNWEEEYLNQFEKKWTEIESKLCEIERKLCEIENYNELNMQIMVVKEEEKVDEPGRDLKERIINDVKQ